MWLRFLGVFLVFLGLLGNGCKKKPENTSGEGSSTNKLSGASIAAPGLATEPSRIHWLGLKKISALPDATNFVAIWNLPETKALLDQTIKKFSEAPWRPQHNGTNGFATNAASALLQPLLQDLVQEECF